MTHNLPQDFLIAIGLMTSCAAQTEGVIEWAIAGCIGVDTEYGGAVTTHMAMPLRFSVLRSVAQIKIDDLDALDELDEILESCEKAFEKRNAIVHHRWCRDPDNDAVFTVKETSRREYEIDLIPMSIDAIKSDVLFVYQAGLTLSSFLSRHKLQPAFPPLRPRSHKMQTARKKRRKDKLRGATL